MIGLIYQVAGGLYVMCGKKVKAHKAKHRWDGFVVCEKDYEPRQPQDFVKARVDKITVPFLRPRPVDIFTQVTYICTPEGSSGVVGLAVAGCSIVGRTESSHYYSPTLAIAGYAVAGLSITGKT